MRRLMGWVGCGIWADPDHPPVSERELAFCVQQLMAAMRPDVSSNGALRTALLTGARPAEG